jgi:TonB family protein
MSFTKGKRRSEDLLFTPRISAPTGKELEIVHYWDDRVLGVEYFLYDAKGENKVIVGSSERSHFVASGGKKDHVLVELTPGGYKLNLADGMSARIRKTAEAKDFAPGSYDLTHEDICHIVDGGSRYFIICKKIPDIKLPKAAPEDPFLRVLTITAMVLYFALSIVLIGVSESDREKAKEEMWALVEVPEEIKKPKIELEKIMKKIPKPPPPKPKPVEPVKPKEKAKPKPKPKKPKKPNNKSLTQAKTQKVASPGKKAGGARKGKEKKDAMGAEGAKNKKPAGVNLSKLGLGAGKISSRSGLGAINVPFKNSAGGAGGGSGTASKTYGLGGIGKGASLALAGMDSAAKTFGTSTGGIAGSEVGSEFSGKTSAEVNIRASDPLVGGSLSQEEVLAVVNANKGQIKHCYSRLLQTSPTSSGTVTVSWVIKTSGSVSNTKIKKSEFKDSSFHRCLTSAIKRWKFPQPRGGIVTVNFPWTLSPD